MSFYLYDNAFEALLKRLLPNTHFVQQELSFEEAAKATDNPSFPLITFYQVATRVKKEHLSMSMARYSTALQGVRDGKVFGVNAIPVHITWQLDFYDPKREVVDEMIRELLFFLIKKPKISIVIRGSVNQPYHWNLDFEEDVVDNSDLVEFKETGRVYRKTLNIFTDEAWLFNSRITPAVAHIEIGMGDERMEIIEIRGEDIVPSI